MLYVSQPKGALSLTESPMIRSADFWSRTRPILPISQLHTIDAMKNDGTLGIGIDLKG
jgi:hypothetical protein